MTQYEHKSVVGKLTRVSHGREDGSDAFYFEYKEDEFLNLKFSGGWDDVKDIPFNTPIALCMSTISIDGYHIVCTHTPYFTQVNYGT